MNPDEILQKHILDLSRASFTRNIQTHTDFLTPEELSQFRLIRTQLDNPRYVEFGGYEFAERVSVVFLPDYAEEPTGVLSCLLVKPQNDRFADELTHRDFLGALMNLGVERSVLGDIVVSENKAFIFCLDKMKDFIIDNLFKVKHTSVFVSETDPSEVTVSQRFEHIEGSIASERLDTVVAMVFKLSRGNAQKLVEDEKVFINGTLTVSDSKNLNKGDRVSVRGFGKFIYLGFATTTRKGRLFAACDKFV